MKLSPEQLTNILNRPGYSMADGSIFDLRPTPAHANPPAPKRHVFLAWRSEREFQEAVIAEAQQRAILQPEYSLLVAIPNGQYRAGQRAEPGLTPGLPDLALFVARGGHGALFLELKVGAGKPSRAQLDMIHRLRMEGYRCEIVWDSLDDVFGIIEEYLEGGRNDCCCD